MLFKAVESVLYGGTCRYQGRRTWDGTCRNRHERDTLNLKTSRIGLMCGSAAEFDVWIRNGKPGRDPSIITELARRQAEK